MSNLTTFAQKAILSGLHFSGVARLLAPVARGSGVIFTLHNVREGEPEAFSPNRILAVTPAFLEAAIDETIAAGYDIVSLDAAADRLASGARGRPFACFTFDDGYRDNRELAYPIFKRRQLPFAIYIPTNYPDGTGDLWWVSLEGAIRNLEKLEITLEGRDEVFDLSTPEGKTAAFHKVYWAFRKLPEAEMRARIQALADGAGFETGGLCAREIMTWDELRAMAADPLVTFGAHTCHHFALAKLPVAQAEAEMRDSLLRLERELGRPCRHFSYPYGDSGSAGAREFAIARGLGFRTAVTTRKNVIRERHRDAMTALPRVSLNGDFQARQFVAPMLTGAPFVLMDGVGMLRGAVRSIFKGLRGIARA